RSVTLPVHRAGTPAEVQARCRFAAPRIGREYGPTADASPGTRLRAGGLQQHGFLPICPVMPAPQRKPTARDNPGAPARGRARRGPSAAVLDARLDLALLATFPASDPIAIGPSTATEPPSRPVERGPVAIDVEGIERVRRQPRHVPER